MKKKIHVLHVVGSMNTGGAEVMVMDMLRHISKDFQFDFLINYKKKLGIPKGDFDQEIKTYKSNINYIPTQWDIGPIKYIIYFRKIYIKLGRPEIVHIHLNAKSGIIALAAKIAGAKKIIVHSHANIVFRGHPLKVKLYEAETFFQKILINLFATDYWGASKEACQSLFYKKRQKNIVIINNAINVDKFQNINREQIKQFKRTFDIKGDTLVFGNIGRIVRHKNVSLIIDTLKNYKNINSDFVFIFAGRIDDQAYFDEIQHKIEKYQLKDKVIYLGNRSDTPLLYNTMDIFIAPALKEGFGMVALEAQASGKACLLYEGFPKTVDMNLGLVKFLDTLSAQIWIENLTEFIDNLPKIDKDLIKKKIKEKGFDIIENIKKIEQLYTK